MWNPTSKLVSLSGLWTLPGFSCPEEHSSPQEWHRAFFVAGNGAQLHGAEQPVDFIPHCCSGLEHCRHGLASHCNALHHLLCCHNWQQDNAVKQHLEVAAHFPAPGDHLGNDVSTRQVHGWAFLQSWAGQLQRWL